MLAGFVERARYDAPRMSPPTIVLHQWLISPFCAKVRKALVAKGLAFEVRDYNGLLAAKAKRLSKAGKLPVLDYTHANGDTITFSMLANADDDPDGEAPAPFEPCNSLQRAMLDAIVGHPYGPELADLEPLPVVAADP